MNGAELLVSAMEKEDVQQIFGVPGEENLDLVGALRRSTIKLVVTRHEQGAAFMAATHGRLTGRAGVCLSTLGPGALNLTTGAAYALLGAMPMIMITGQKGIRSRKQARFQVVDMISTMTPLTKMAHSYVCGMVVLATLLIAAPSVHAACKSPKNICKHFDDCLQRTSDPNNKDVDDIRAGVKARDGQIVLAGAEACARDLGRKQQWNKWARGCSVLELVQIARAELELGKVYCDRYSQ